MKSENLNSSKTSMLREKMGSKLVLLALLTFVSMAFMVSSVSAIGFSPTSLIFNLSINQQACGIIHLSSDSPMITVFDNWAENKSVNWSVYNFQTPASAHNLTLTYPKNLTLDMREVEVCLKGSTPGEYHGVIIFRQAQEGNSIIQLGIWLKAIINGGITPPITPEDNRWIWALSIVGVLVLVLLAFVIHKITE
ncbi:MAG: hypothetical protein NT076_03830 [Candidatus Pacearchaeota archaeon]|nr:hypothetical protein [Candidatus Pacearchaeota archaeon]